jgi:protein-tyrosine phosphatase
MRSPFAIARSLDEMLVMNYGTGRGWVRAMLADLELAAGRVARFNTFQARNTTRLVFVCQGNICRSAFADRLARAMRLNSGSLGLATNSGMGAFELARDTAAMRGVDLSSHRTTAWADYRSEDGDLLLAMEIRHAHQLLRLGVPAERIALLGQWARPRRIHLHDPYTLSRPYFQTCFALIDSAVRNLAFEFAEGGSPAARDFPTRDDGTESGPTTGDAKDGPGEAAR